MRVDQRLEPVRRVEHGEALLGRSLGAGDAARDLGHRLAGRAAIAAVPTTVCERDRARQLGIEAELLPALASAAAKRAT